MRSSAVPAAMVASLRWNGVLQGITVESFA